MGLDALQHMESSLIRDQTHVPCVSRWILYHWITREVPEYSFFFFLISHISEIIMSSVFIYIVTKSRDFFFYMAYLCACMYVYHISIHLLMDT